MGLKKLLCTKFLSAVAAVAMIASVEAITSFDAVAVGGASDNVKQNENGVIKIESVYGDANYLVSSCTGFIINNSTVITSKDVLPASAEAVLTEAMGPDFEFDSSKLKVRTKISNVYVDATSVLGDSDNDFAVLRLSKAINFDQSDYFDLPLGDSDSIETTETVYSIGYSMTDSDTTVINEGKISKIDTNSVEYTMNNPTKGFIGSPVINQDGSVVAVTIALRDDGYKAIPINNIEGVLNTFTIEYKTGVAHEISVPTESSIVEQSVSSPEPSAYVQMESSVISEPETSVISRPEAERSHSDDDVPDEVVPDGEEEELDLMMILIIAGVVVVVIVIVIIIIVLATKKKPQPVTQPTVTTPPQQFLNNQQSVGNNRANIPPTQPNVYSTQPNTYNQNTMNQGAGETTVLNEGAGETTILGGTETVGIPSGVLVNTKTGEKVIINKPEFAIGKERSKVDYCISNDNSVSRLHLKIRVRAGKCFIVDMNSKNGTYINGNKLTPNQEVMIQNGDKLKISLIEFEFRN